jgi:hypothetical protein
VNVVSLSVRRALVAARRLGLYPRRILAETLLDALQNEGRTTAPDFLAVSHVEGVTLTIGGTVAELTLDETKELLDVLAEEVVQDEAGGGGR